ncbi:MAG: hypothetical protein A2051_10215 [Desulfovibrionales bacterium GWA2_65_9]|nr:MAG: hypothetical protein A2051_10215 [Desulfovibrionales bacterium GWA2_65_9]
MVRDTDLTILLPIKGNVCFTWRFMAWAEAVRLPFALLIADGSEGDETRNMLSDPGRFPNMRYDYVRHAPDADLTRYYAKMAESLERIATPYAVVSCNDDFHLPGGLRAAMALLNENPDAVAAGGDMQDFVVEPGCRPGAFERVYGPLSLTQRVFHAGQNTAATTRERIRQFMRHGFNTSLWTAVHRTGTLRASYQTLRAAAPGDVYFSDHLLSLMTLTAGTALRTPMPFYLHQACSHESMGGELSQAYPTQRHWLKRPGWKDDFERVVETVAQAIAEHDGLGRDEAREFMRGEYLARIGATAIDQATGAVAPEPESDQAAMLASQDFQAIMDHVATPPPLPEELTQLHAAMTRKPGALRQLRHRINQHGYHALVGMERLCRRLRS